MNGAQATAALLVALSAALACSEHDGREASDGSAPQDASEAGANAPVDASLTDGGTAADSAASCDASSSSDACAAPTGTCIAGCSGHGRCEGLACVCDAPYTGATCSSCAPGFVASGTGCVKDPACGASACSVGAFECSAGMRRECVSGGDNCPSWQPWSSCEGKRCVCPYPPDPKVTIEQWSFGSMDEATAVAIEASGAVLVAGAQSLTTSGSSSAQFVGTFGASGNAWYETWGDGSSSAFDLLVNAQGDVFVAGQFNGNANGMMTRGSAATVTRFDAQHKRQSMVVWDGASSDFAWSVAEGPSGDLLVAGETNGQLGAPGAGGIDGFVGRATRGGQVLWTKQLGTASDDSALQVKVAADGSIYVVGTLGEDAFLRKLGGEGNEVWTAKWSSTGYDAAWGVALAADGGSIYVAGLAQGDVGAAGQKGAFVSRVAAGGEVTWTKYFSAPGAMFDNAKAIRLTSTGDVCVAGETSGELATPGRGSDRDVFVRCLSPSGDVRWTKQIGGPGSERVHDLAIGPDGTFYVAGSVAGAPYPGFATTQPMQSFLIRARP